MAVLLAMAAAAPARADVHDDLNGLRRPWPRLAEDQLGQGRRGLRRLAGADNAEGQFHLGALYESGQGVTQNYGQAVAWYRAAAEQGLAVAQFKHRRHVPEGPRGATRHRRRHISGTILRRRRKEPGRAQARDFVAHRMTLPQIAAAQKLAAGWRPKIGS